MAEQDFAKIFGDRLFEKCLENDLSQECLIDKFSKDFSKPELESFFSGNRLPPPNLVIALAMFFNTSVDSFFVPGEKVSDKSLLKIVQKERKIKHMEKVLGRKISYSADNYKKTLFNCVKEALNKELMSISKAASVLDVNIMEARKIL